MSFHVRQDVAPLKHRLRQLIDWRAGPFPRPTGRGPIEANRKCAVPPDDCGLFPRPTGRGPIEAMDGAIHMTAIDVFPRPTGRGPIEAVEPRCRSAGIREFPRPTGRGPIEAVVGG